MDYHYGYYLTTSLNLSNNILDLDADEYLDLQLVDMKQTLVDKSIKGSCDYLAFGSTKNV